MTRVIRNYQPGSQIVLSEQLRHHMLGGGDTRISEGDMAHQQRTRTEDMAAEATAVLAQAREEAAALLRAADEKVTVLQAEAQARGFEEGYAKGFVEGRAIGEQALIAGIEEIQSVLLSIQDERAHLMLNAEHEVVTLATAIAEKIVGRLAHANQHLIVHTVNRALNDVTITGPFSLRVHPNDAAYLADHWQGTDSDGEAYAWKLIPDESIEVGGCVLGCGPASVDARISSQFRTIVNGLGLTDYTLGSESNTPHTDEAHTDEAHTDEAHTDESRTDESRTDESRNEVSGT